MLHRSFSKQGVGLNLRLEYIDDVIKERPDVPYVEVIVDNWFCDGPHHRKLEEIREMYDISFHCVGMNLCGHENIDLTYLEKVRRLQERFRPFQVSDHLSVQSNKGVFFHDLLPVVLNESVLKSSVRNIRTVQEFLGHQILVENGAYYTTFEGSNIDEAEFINTIQKEANCGLLLDLNNSWVNAINHNFDLMTFIDSINLSEVKELHLAGAETRGPILVDTHGASVHDDVLDAFEKVAPSLGEVTIIYERDTNIPSLEELQSERTRIEDRLYAQV